MAIQEERRQVKLGVILPTLVVLVLQVISATWFASQMFAEMRENKKNIEILNVSFSDYKKTALNVQDSYITKKEFDLYQKIDEHRRDSLVLKVNDILKQYGKERIVLK